MHLVFFKCPSPNEGLQGIKRSTEQREYSPLSIYTVFTVIIIKFHIVTTCPILKTFNKATGITTLFLSILGTALHDIQGNALLF